MYQVLCIKTDTKKNTKTPETKMPDTKIPETKIPDTKKNKLLKKVGHILSSE